MKTIVSESSSPLSWYFLPDSALVNAGKPFFIPDFADQFEAFMSPVVRITRIGKSIAARFSDRYFSELAPAIHFRASDMRRQLLAAGLPPDPSQSFDRSLTVGEFIPMNDFSPADEISFLKNGEVVSSCRIEEWKSYIALFLEKISLSNTIKMGDYLVPCLYGPAPIKIGDRLSIVCGHDSLLSINIK